jgi:dihydrofolate reductase
MIKVFIIAALSADGFIGQDAKQRALDWTSKEDRQLLIQLSREAGVIVMGSKTYATFKISQAPPGRRLIIYTSHPEMIHGERVETTNEEPEKLIERLEKEGAHGLAIEGGSTVYKMFMERGLVDELYLTIEPVLFGKGIPLFNEGLKAVSLKLLECRPLNDNTILVHYSVNK